MSASVEDFPTRIADFLESITGRIRAMTTDRVARIITYLTLGMVILTLVVLSLLFLLVGTFRITGELVRKACDCTIHMEITYAAVGGLFLLLGVFLWSRRRRPVEEDDE